MAFKMRGYSAFTKTDDKDNPARTGNLKENVKGAIKNIKNKIKNIDVDNIKKNIKVKADQIPYVGPSTSIYSTKHKAQNPHRFPEATINQPGYEDIKKKTLEK